MSSELPNFLHRKNADATVESICTFCFLNVGSAMSEADLRSKEVQHHCDPFLVAYFAFFKNEPHSEIPEQVGAGKKGAFGIY